MLETLLPMAAQALGNSGGLSGLAGLIGGGGTEVDQNVSQSTSAVLLSNVNNTIGPGSAQSGPVSLPVTQTQSQTQTKPLNTSPPLSAGDMFSNDYEPGSLARSEGEPVQAGFNPVFVVVVLGVAALFLFNKG